MRHGKLLAENAPDELMSQYHMESLEDVFLKLCVTDTSLKAASLATNTHFMPQTINQSPDKYLNNQLSNQKFNQNITNGVSKNGIKVI